VIVETYCVLSPGDDRVEHQIVVDSGQLFFDATNDLSGVLGARAWTSTPTTAIFQ